MYLEILNSLHKTSYTCNLKLIINVQWSMDIMTDV